MDPTQIPLRDLHLPDPIGWWPLAPGWWLLIATAFLGLCYLARLGWLRWRRNRLRRVALRELTALTRDYEQGAELVTLSIRLSELLRRAMLAYAPRREVAGLTGAAWLGWLDRGLEDRPFTTGPARVLEELPYRRERPDDASLDFRELTRVVGLRIRTPLPEHG